MNSVSTTTVFVLIQFTKLSLLMQVNSVISPLPTGTQEALMEIPYDTPLCSLQSDSWCGCELCFGALQPGFKAYWLISLTNCLNSSA